MVWELLFELAASLVMLLLPLVEDVASEALFADGEFADIGV